MDKRGWSQNETARRAGMSSGFISIVLNEKQEPKWEFCYGIAQAFGMAPEHVFRKAGLLPVPREEQVQILTDIGRSLSESELSNVIEYAQWRLENEKAKL